MVCILLLPGWMKVIGSELVVMEVLVIEVTKCLEAAILIKAVEDKSERLAQPDSRLNKFTK